jgi:phage-related protein
MAGSLGRAFVEVFADLDKFTPGLKQKIKAALDEQTKGIKFDELDKSAERAGRSAADQLAKGVDSKIENNMFASGRKGGSGLNRGMASAVGALSGLLLPILIAFGVQAAAALVPATTALAATIPAAIFTTAGAIGVLLIATNGVGEALKNAFDPARAEQFQKAMEKLAPAAQSFVREIQGLGPAFTQLRKDVQQVFFTQLQGVLTNVAAKLLPTLRTGLKQLGADMGALGAGVLNAFGSGQEDIASIFIAAHEAIKPFIPAVAALVSAFLTLGAVGGPLFATLSGGLADMLVRFNEFIQAAAASGSLAGFFDVMLVVLREIGAILSSITGLFGGLLAAMQETGYDSLSLLGQLVEMLNVFFNSAEGQEALIAAFTLVNAVLETLFSILGPLMPAIASLVTEFSGGLTDALKTVTPYLQGAAEWLGQHPDVIKAAVVAWGAYKLAMIGVALFQAAVLATNPIGWIVLAIAAIAAGAYLIYKNWSVVTDALSSAGEAIGNFFSGVWQWVQGVGSSIANWFTVTLPNFFAAIPGAVWAALSALPGMLWNLFLDALNLAGQAIGMGIGLILAVFIALPGLIWEAIKAIGNFFFDLWNAAFELGRTILSAGIDGVIWFFTELPVKIANWVNRLPGIIGGAFRTAWENAKQFVRDGADAVVDFVQKLPGRIGGFMRNVGSTILGGLKSGINSIIGGFNSGINRVGDAVGISLPNIPLLANGGLITSPTLAIVGEAGKEAVIPMSNPAKAEQVARETGLLSMLGSRVGHSEMPNVKVYLGTREITDILDVRIDNKLDSQANELAYGTR